MRQLEAIIRLSESLAKMELSPTVNAEHVKEAHRLFQISTMNAATSGMSTDLSPPEEIRDIVIRIEEALQNRLAIGGKMSRSKLEEEMIGRFSNERAVIYVRGQRETG